MRDGALLINEPRLSFFDREVVTPHCHVSRPFHSPSHSNTTRQNHLSNLSSDQQKSHLGVQSPSFVPPFPAREIPHLTWIHAFLPPGTDQRQHVGVKHGPAFEELVVRAKQPSQMPSTKRRAEVTGEAARKRHHTTRTGMDQSTTASTQTPVNGNIPESAPPPQSSDNEHLKVVATLCFFTAQANPSQALTLLQGDFENLRHSLTCKICEKLFYEPFVLSCGHTYCYRSLSSWFTASRKPTCPNCRVRIVQLPAPSYVIKELVNTISARAELLPDGETVEEHITWKQEEADFYNAERVKEQGLFQGLFKEKLRTVHDASDGVERCPTCNWELEDGYCNHCDMDFGSGSGSDSGEGNVSYDESEEDSDLDADDDVDADITAVDADAHWFDGEMSPDGSEDDNEHQRWRQHERRHARLDRDLAGGHPGRHLGQHFAAHRDALRTGQASAGWFSRSRNPFSWIPQTGPDVEFLPSNPYGHGHLSDRSGDEDEEDEGSMDGFIVNDDGLDPQSPISISSQSEVEEEEPAPTVLSWRQRRRVQDESADETSDSSGTSDTETDSEDDSDEHGDDDSNDSDESSSEDEDDEPPRSSLRGRQRSQRPLIRPQHGPHGPSCTCPRTTRTVGF